MQEVQLGGGGETVDAVQMGIIPKYLELTWQEDPPYSWLKLILNAFF